MPAQRLSIVTPTRHSPHLLDRLYNSLVHQTCAEFEHVLVDTSVDDATLERWCRDFAPHLDQRFRYARIHLPDPNMAAAYEYAFDQATGDYVCPMTHKSLWRADAVESFLRIFDRFPNIPAFSFGALYLDQDLHTNIGDFRAMEELHFGSAWDGAEPVAHDSRALFLTIAHLFGDHGYHGPFSYEQLKAPLACHAVYSRNLLTRVRKRFGTIVAGKFAGDSRLGYRVMDLEREVLQFTGFTPRMSSVHSKTGASGSQLHSWRYLRNAFATLSPETKAVISRSPYGYLPLWAVLTYWEIFSVIDEAQEHLKVELTFEAYKHHGNVCREIEELTEIDEDVRAGLLRHVEAIGVRHEGGIVRTWF